MLRPRRDGVLVVGLGWAAVLTRILALLGVALDGPCRVASMLYNAANPGWNWGCIRLSVQSLSCEASQWNTRRPNQGTLGIMLLAE